MLLDGNPAVVPFQTRKAINLNLQSGRFRFHLCRFGYGISGGGNSCVLPVFRNDGLQPLLKTRLGCDAQSGQVLLAQRRERLLVSKFADDALVLDNRVVGLAELAVTFAETENR